MSNKRLKTTHGSPIIKEDLPCASISDLPNDVLKYCFSFIPGQYIAVAPVCRHFYSNYCTMGMDDSDTVNSADALFQISRNKRTTADAVSDDVKLFEHFIINHDVPQDFIYEVCNKAAIKRRRDVIECAVAFGVEHGEEDGEYGEEDSDELFRLDNKVLETLGQEGDLDMLKFLDSKFRLSEQNEDYDHRLDADGWEAIMLGAAGRGHVDILDWVSEIAYHIVDHQAEIGEDDIVSQIGALGNYESVLWCQKVWPSECFQYYDCEVARSGNVQVFKHLEHTFNGSGDPFEGAVQSGSIEMLEYCHQKQYPFDEKNCAKSFDNTDKDQALKVLQWLRQHNYPWDEQTCYSAAKYDNIKALKWARSEGCPWNEETFAAAAENGNIEILEYCLDNGCPMDARACMMAVKNENDSKALETLKWLRKHSCPWDERTYLGALSKNFFCFLFAHENGCPRGDVHPWLLVDIIGCKDTHVFARFLQGYEKLADYTYFKAIFKSSAPNSVIIEKLILLQKYGYEWTARFCSMATEFGNLKILQWLRYHGCPWDVETCNSAVKSTNLKALKYVHKNGCEWNKHTFAYCMERCGLENEVDKIPTKPGWGMKKIYDYLVRNDCPRPETNDWRIKTSDSPWDLFDDSFDDDSSDDDSSSDDSSGDNLFPLSFERLGKLGNAIKEIETKLKQIVEVLREATHTSSDDNEINLCIDLLPVEAQIQLWNIIFT